MLKERTATCLSLLELQLINLRTHKFGQCDIINPLSEKFGIGYYYDDVNPQFLDAFGVASLRSEAERIEREEQAEVQKQAERNELLKTIGRERLEKLISADAKAVIIAELHENESDPMTDYYGYSTKRTVILGFSTHTKDIFSEMRKFAANFEGTAYLAEEKAEYENREKYSGGAGYYLGKSKYSDWIVEKDTFWGNHERTVECYALIAGDENNICLKAQADKAETATKTAAETVTGDFNIVDYSEKALAVFGDTKAVKNELKALCGRFNPKLTYNGRKAAGWIFQKSRKQELRNLLNI